MNISTLALLRKIGLGLTLVIPVTVATPGCDLGPVEPAGDGGDTDGDEGATEGGATEAGEEGSGDGSGGAEGGPNCEEAEQICANEELTPEQCAAEFPECFEVPPVDCETIGAHCEELGLR